MMKAGGGENGEGGVEVQYLPCIRDLVVAYKVTPLPPYPITSPGRSAGVGGERTGHKQSRLPPRHSSTTLPKLETVWARAPAGLCWDAVLLYTYQCLFMSSSFFLTWRHSDGWRGWILSCKPQGS